MYHRIALIITVACALAACGTGPAAPAPVPTADTASVADVGSVTLRQRADDTGGLDIAVVLFDRGLDATAVAAGDVFPTVRKAESILLPTKLSDRLASSGFWGPVRVVHTPVDAAPVLVSGEILRADGEVLELALRVNAADGQQLLQRRYRDVTTPEDYPVDGGEEPFADLYRAISNDLADIARGLSDTRRRQLERIALMNFAARLVPGAFDDYLERNARGLLELRRFPASGDPMLARLQRLRRQEYLFIDTVDQQYRDLGERIGDSYDLWRQYSRELSLYGERYLGDVETRERAGRRGSYAALQQVYGSFRKVKLQEEDLRELVRGFAGESLDTVMAVDDGVVRLQGSVEERYAQWRRLLLQIYSLETDT